MNALIKYEQFVHDGLNNKNPLDDLKYQIYLGSDNFISKVASYVGPSMELTDIPMTQLPTLNLTLADEYVQTCNRDDAICRAYCSGSYLMKEIGKYFGLHYSRISRIIKHFYQQKARSDTGFSAVI